MYADPSPPPHYKALWRFRAPFANRYICGLQPRLQIDPIRGHKLVLALEVFNLSRRPTRLGRQPEFFVCRFQILDRFIASLYLLYED